MHSPESPAPSSATPKARSSRGERLVIFGCGYLGSAVALEGVRRGLKVTALTRNAAKATLLREQGVEPVVADLAGDTWHRQIEGEAAWVLNCVSSGGGGVDGYRHSYVAGMESILAWQHRSGAADTMVYTSSTSVYPQGEGAIVDESAEIGGSERAELLVQAERQLRAAAAASGRWFILRLAGIYGPMRHHFFDRVLSGEVAGQPEPRLNLIHRDDAAAAIWACLSAPAGIGNEIYNVADDGAAPKGEIAAWIARAAGQPLPRFTGEPVSVRRGVTPDRVIANGKLKRQLGWSPGYPSFREGFANFLSR